MSKIDPYTGELIEQDLDTLRQMMFDPLTYTRWKPMRTKKSFWALLPETTLSTTTSEDERIGRAIGQAILHARRVCKREHLKGDRVERVNQFMTSLRREIAAINHSHGNALLSSLLLKELWYDAGELAPVFPTYGNRYTKETILKWLQYAKTAASTEYEKQSIIQDGLDDLQQSLVGMNILVQESGRIAEEGEVVSQKLCRILT